MLLFAGFGQGMLGQALHQLLDGAAALRADQEQASEQYVSKHPGVPLSALRHNCICSTLWLPSHLVLAKVRVHIVRQGLVYQMSRVSCAGACAAFTHDRLVIIVFVLALLVHMCVYFSLYVNWLFRAGLACSACLNG